MKLIRKIDSLGRVCIPKDILDSLGINKGDSIIFDIKDGDKCIFVKSDRHCFFCSSTKDLTTLTINGSPVCDKCVPRIKEVL